MNHLLHELEHEQYGMAFPPIGVASRSPCSPRRSRCGGGVGERRTLRVVAEVTDGWNTFLMPEGEYRHKLEVLAGHC